jgi:hypothetical protein
MKDSRAKVKTRTRSETERMRHPREFQSCFELTPVPRGRVVYAPNLRPKNLIN